VLDLREVGVRVAVIDESVEELGGLPNGLLTFLEGKVLLLFAEDVLNGLVLVVLAVELCYARRDGGIILAEFFLAFALFVAAGEKTIPFFKVLKRVIGICRACAVECDAHRWASCRFLAGESVSAGWARDRAQVWLT
jgi:hypothetical protein